MHFAMKLFLAAPCRGLPSALTALPAQASRLHFLMKLALAAPWSGWPAALTAWLSQGLRRSRTNRETGDQRR